MLDTPVCEMAPAKINLHLQVGAKRTDGFHEIESIFQSISLADWLLVRVSENFSVTCVNYELPAENSLTKAYRVFCAKTGFHRGVEVTLIKRIPACAGLGGASTDAVALLKALNRLSDVSLSETELAAVALEVGSDCPFFIKAGTAFVSGRGEILESVQSKAGCGLLIFPQVPSKTEKAYSLLDTYRNVKSEATDEKPVELRLGSTERELQLRALYTAGDFSAWSGSAVSFTNDFETVVFAQHREVAEAKKALLKAGADFALMTGSGSAVFGLFERDTDLQSAEKKLKTQFRFCEPFIFI